VEHLSGTSDGSPARNLPPILVLVLIAGYALTLSWLSLERHAAHATNALDLGYYSNTLWNTLHSQPFRFTTYHQANFVFPEFDPNVARQPDDLLAYHVEPILLPLSLLYALWPDPRILLIAQSLILATGAWPVYQIARRHRFSSWLALAFPLIYLSSPSLIGANLSDFHPLAFSAPLMLWAFDTLERGAFWIYFVFMVLILMLKEEMGLGVSLLGLWAIAGAAGGFGDWLPHRQRFMSGSARTRIAAVSTWLRSPRVRAGLITVLMAALWTGAATLIQRDAAGPQLSMFASRYAWLGHTPKEILANALTTRAVVDWLRQPGAYDYLGFMLAQTGFVALLAPEILLLALPETAINLFSNFDWMHSGLAHYSAPIVPFVVIGAIVGARRIAGWLSGLEARRQARGLPPARARVHPVPGLRPVERSASTGLSPALANSQTASNGWSATFIVGIALAGALYQAHLAGQVPLSRNYIPANITEHDARLSVILSQIPSAAAISAQSDLYPHVPERANLYLFPTVSDADFILLDVTGQTYPIQTGEYVDSVKQLLYQSPAGLIAADDGYLLLARNEGKQTGLPDAFFSFARAGSRMPQHPLNTGFGQDLEMVGYDIEPLSPRQVHAPAINVRTYWRGLRPLTDKLRFVYRINAPDGLLVNAQYGSPTEMWYPTNRWNVGEVVVVEQRGLQIPRGDTVGVRVERGDPAAPIVEVPQSTDRAVIENGVLRLPLGN
jgi:uncharacterized membrane protein